MGEQPHQPKADDESTHDPRSRSRARMTWVVVITGAFMVLEIAGGIVSGSIALLTDAFHMMTHFVATGISLLALHLAARPAAPEKTFRWWRIEVLAALFNGVALIPLVGWILYEAWNRYHEPEEVRTWVMLTVGFLGLGANLVCAWILHAASDGDLNVRGAFLHMLSDTISSVGVLAAAILMAVFDEPLFDPLIAALISVLVLVWSVKLILDSLAILLEAAPRGVKIEEVERVICGQEGVQAVHDLHLWVITSRMYSLTVHVVLEGDMRVRDTATIAESLDRTLDQRFDITHTTYQFESEGGGKTSQEAPEPPISP